MAHFGLVAGRFSLGPKIGAGSFGVIYLGTDHWARREVAIKVELATASKKCLAHEAEIYRQLQNSAVAPRLFWDGKAFDGTRLMVTELLGPSLEDLFAHCKRRFSLKTTLALADQMLMCLEVVHAAGLIHRDLKPDNFLIGLGYKAGTVHLIDYGLAAPWVDRKAGCHVRFREGRGRVGTAWYSSRHASSGSQQSRRDDLESLGYVLLHFLRGSLPWQHATLFCHTDEERFKEIMQRKQTLSVPDLCSRLPREIGEYVRYSRALQFEECPDYAFLRNLLADCFEEQGFVHDGVFDWTLPHCASLCVAAAAAKRGPYGGNEIVISHTLTPQESDWLATSDDADL